MPYYTTSSEKKYILTPAGLYDAPGYLNNNFFLAEGLLNAGYGALIRSDGFTADYDIYHLGTLQAGNYTLDVDGENWDFSNGIYGFDTNIAQFGIADSDGYWIDYTTNTIAELSFTLNSSKDVYAVVVGKTYTDTEYRIFYSYDGLANSVASWASSASYTGELVSGASIDASIVYSDLDLNSDGILLTSWYVDGVMQGVSDTFELTDTHIGKILSFSFAFYDDAGNLEISPTFSAGTVLKGNTSAVWAETAQYTGSLRVGQSIDASITYSDNDGNSDDKISTWWYLDDTYVGAFEEFEITESHLSQILKFKFAFYDDEGHLETSPLYTAGKIMPDNSRPTITSSALTSTSENDVYTYKFTASDLDVNDSITLSAEKIPDWLDFDPATGNLTGRPGQSEVGEHSIVLRATDNAGEYAEQSFTLNVKDVNDLPSLSFGDTLLVAGVLAPQQTLTVYLHDLIDADGTKGTSFEYQWFADDEPITGATSSSYKLSDQDVGKTIGIRVKYTDDAGFSNVIYNNLKESVVDRSVSSFDIPALRYGAKDQIPYFIGIDKVTVYVRDDNNFSYAYNPDDSAEVNSQGGIGIEYGGNIIPNSIIDDRGISRITTSENQFLDVAYFHLDGIHPSIPNDIPDGVSSLMIPLGSSFDYFAFQKENGAELYDEFVSTISAEVQVPSSVYYGPGRVNWLKQLLSDLEHAWLAQNTDDQNLEGSSSADILIGGLGDDSIFGFEGNDTLNGGAGDDILNGGSGYNSLVCGEGDDTTILEGVGKFGSNLFAHNISSQFQTGTEELKHLNGKTRFGDVVDGGIGIDALKLTDASDAFFLHDSFSGFHTSLVLSDDHEGRSGTARIENIETINAGGGDDIIDLTSSSYSLVGQNITVIGGEGHDTLWGSDANEVLLGGSEEDILFGGAGTNTLTGGSGADEFQFTRTSTDDTVTDFSISEGDTLKFFNTGGVEFDTSSMVLAGESLHINYSDADSITILLEGTNLTVEDLSDSIFVV